MLSVSARRLCFAVLLLPALALLGSTSAHAQKEPGFQGPFALTNAQIIVSPADTIDSGTVVIRNDSIAARSALPV